MLNNILIIACGSALGGVLRFLSYEIINSLTKNLIQNNLIIGFNKFPFATFLVNVIGSFLAGILYFFIIKNFSEFSIDLKNFLLIGLLGGYTTFSAFSLDLFRLIQANQNSIALLYAISSVLISLIAIFFGYYLMKFFS
jgi:CrcB protein